MSSSLKDYNSRDKLDVYERVITDPTIPSVRALYYNLYFHLPDLKDKVILDLPCGLGIKARDFIGNYGARKVIGVDIVQKQLDVAKERSTAAGIEDSCIEYFCHDAKVVKKISESLADVCVSAHLTCFAENFDELVKIGQNILLNLKTGGQLFLIGCSLNKEDVQMIKDKHEAFGQPVIYLDPWRGNKYTPRKLVTTIQGFQFESRVWEADAIVEAFLKAGFSRVELHPYKPDPEYNGSYNLSEFLKLVDGNVVVAIK